MTRDGGGLCLKKGLLALGLCLALCMPAWAKKGEKIEFPPVSADQIIKADVFPKTRRPSPPSERNESASPESRPESKPEAEKTEKAKKTEQKVKKETAAKKTSAKNKKTNLSQEARQREARIRSISELFSRYNRRLTTEQARTYAGYILQAAEKFKQDPLVLAAIIVHESSARPDVISKGGDYGLMQVRWSVHKANIRKKYPQIKKAKDILDPKYNVLVGTEIFSACRTAAPDLRGGLLRYSAGNGKMANKVLASKKELEDACRKHLKSLS